MVVVSLAGLENGLLLLLLLLRWKVVGLGVSGDVLGFVICVAIAVGLGVGLRLHFDVVGKEVGRKRYLWRMVWVVQTGGFWEERDGGDMGMVFEFDGRGMRRLMRQMEDLSLIKDIRLAVALFEYTPGRHLLLRH